MASTEATTPAVHVEYAEILVNHICEIIVANDDNYALAA